jgi:hypothetical protein
MHLKTTENLILNLRGSKFQIHDKNYWKHTHGEKKRYLLLLKHSMPNSKIRSPFIEFYTESQINGPFV